MSSDLSPEARKVLSRWTKQGLYVYLRPISSLWVQPTKSHTTYWNVLVEHRNVKWKQWKAEGRSLDACILELADEVPRKIKGAGPTGWLGPKSKKRKKKRAV